MTDVRTSNIREGVHSLLDHLEWHNFNRGFEACLNGLDEISNRLHNDGRQHAAEIIRQVIMELKGEDNEEN